MAGDDKPKKKRGPRGGTPHQPGKDHDRKSGPRKKKRFSKKAAQKRHQRQEEARRAWAAWDALPEEVRRLLGPTAQPKMPRPTDDA